MNTLLAFWRSTIGKKVVMGVTGLIGLGFVIGHMAGNLQAFSGEAKIDAYGALLHGPLHEVLLIARVVLIAAVLLHITAAYQLTMISRAARPVDYANRKPQVSTLASKTLRWGGVLLLVFIVFHILHFTIGTVHPDFVAGRVYRNLSTGFAVKWVAAFYLVSAEAYLATHARGVFKMAFLGIGPTELRILIAAGACALSASPVINPMGLAEIRLFDLGGIVGVIGMVTTFIVTTSKNIRALYLEETRRS